MFEEEPDEWGEYVYRPDKKQTAGRAPRDQRPQQQNPRVMPGQMRGDKAPRRMFAYQMRLEERRSTREAGRNPNE